MCRMIAVYSKRDRKAYTVVKRALLDWGPYNNDGTGISYQLNKDLMRYFKSNADAKEYFSRSDWEGTLKDISGSKVLLGHVRYAVSGGKTPDDAHPFLGSHKGHYFNLCHNGWTMDTEKLRKWLKDKGREPKTKVDSELLKCLVEEVGIDNWAKTLDELDIGGKINVLIMWADKKNEGNVIIQGYSHGDLYYYEDKNFTILATEPVAVYGNKIRKKNWTHLESGELATIKNGSIDIKKDIALDRKERVKQKPYRTYAYDDHWDCWNDYVYKTPSSIPTAEVKEDLDGDWDNKFLREVVIPDKLYYDDVEEEFYVENGDPVDMINAMEMMDEYMRAGACSTNEREFICDKCGTIFLGPPAELRAKFCPKCDGGALYPMFSYMDRGYYTRRNRINDNRTILYNDRPSYSM